MGRLDRATRLDSPKHREQLRRGHIGDRPAADPRENVALEPADDLVAVRVGSVRRHLRVPLTRDRLEAVRRALGLHGLVALRCTPGSTSSASSLRAPSRRARALVRPTSGYVPIESSFALPPNAYRNRHHLPPAGETPRYKPAPSNIFRDFGHDFALRIAVSVSAVVG